MKNKLTKAIDAELKTIAGKLPADTYQARTKLMYGSEILAEDPEAKDRAGNKIDAKTRYVAPEPHPVNHLRRLRSAFKSGGKDAVCKYLEKYFKVEQENAEPVPVN